MARPPRHAEAGSILHLGASGAARQQLFRDQSDREGFLAQLDLVIKRFRWSCLSYCLMGNHYHLLIELQEANLSEGMQVLNGEYARKFNDRHVRNGCLFGSRFWSHEIQTDRYFHAVVRYINLNPVEAQFCRAPEQWQWSSHHELAAEAPASRVGVERTLVLLGAAHGSDHRPYLDLVGSPSRDPLTYLMVRLAELSPAERSVELMRLKARFGYSTPELARAVQRSTRTVERWIASASTLASDPNVGGDIGV
jgi:REP element-mobilizing transposase RayT